MGLKSPYMSCTFTDLLHEFPVEFLCDTWSPLRDLFCSDWIMQISNGDWTQMSMKLIYYNKRNWGLRSCFSFFPQPTQDCQMKVFLKYFANKEKRKLRAHFTITHWKLNKILFQTCLTSWAQKSCWNSLTQLRSHHCGASGLSYMISGEFKLIINLMGNSL